MNKDTLLFIKNKLHLFFNIFIFPFNYEKNVLEKSYNFNIGTDTISLQLCKGCEEIQNTNYPNSAIFSFSQSMKHQDSEKVELILFSELQLRQIESHLLTIQFRAMNFNLQNSEQQKLSEIVSMFFKNSSF
jgi:hypothetical protein